MYLTFHPSRQHADYLQDAHVTPPPMSPSLALLNFEQSPLDKPMFELAMHHRSTSGSSLEIHHSSPMTVPGSARQATPYNTFPPAMDLPAGTVPDTPGPMQRAFDCDPANHIPWHITSPIPVKRCTPSTPALTPLPDTNLSVEDVDPELVPLPPSVDPFTVHLSRSTPGHYHVSVDKDSRMDEADMLNGFACLKLADRHSSASEDRRKFPHHPITDAPGTRLGTAVEMRYQYEDTKLQDTFDTLGLDRIREHRRQQQTVELQENIRTLRASKHHQVLLSCLSQRDGGMQDLVRKDSCVSEDWETCSGEHSIAMASVCSLDDYNFHQTRTSSPASDYFTGLPLAESKRAGQGDAAPLNFSCVVWDSSTVFRGAPAPKNAWCGHTGLYDGTGYGDDSGRSRAREPDEGIHDSYLKAPSAPLSVNGARSGEVMSDRQSRNEELHENIAYSPLIGHGHGSCMSLESIYRAYAYPLGENAEQQQQ